MHAHRQITHLHTFPHIRTKRPWTRRPRHHTSALRAQAQPARPGMFDTPSDVESLGTGERLGCVRTQRPGDRSHFCVCCSLPILVYGRLYPCLHAFCLTCATDMTGCFM
eukprot:289255-Chlamydomonas_euryale.AAC.10